MYTKPTASYVAKDKEFDRIVDNKEKERLVTTKISQHNHHIQTQKHNTGLISWLINKRNAEIE